MNTSDESEPASFGPQFCMDLGCLHSHLDNLKMIVDQQDAIPQVHRGHFIPEYIEPWIKAPFRENGISAASPMNQRKIHEVWQEIGDGNFRKIDVLRSFLL